MYPRRRLPLSIHSSCGPISLSLSTYKVISALMEPSIDVDKLTYEIFTILEAEFLKLGSPPTKQPISGKVRILSIDAGGSALLAASSIARLESYLRHFSGDSSAHITDFFDIAAGSGAGGLLASMLFTRDPNGSPLFSAEQAFHFLAKKPKKGILRQLFRRNGGASGFRWLFGDATLRDTLKPLLVPCYDVATASQFMFSRADAIEVLGYDFALRDVCAATCSDCVVKVKSVDRQTRVVAVGGGTAMANPTAAAITHVLNNKREFPMVSGVEDLLVVSFSSDYSRRDGALSLLVADLVRIAGEKTADMVDQMVSTAFGLNCTTNYVRIQVNRLGSGKTAGADKDSTLSEQNVESVLFKGRKLSEKTNGDKLEDFAAELVRQHQRRMRSCVTTAEIKSTMMLPRTSAFTTVSNSTRTSTTIPSTPSFSSWCSPDNDP